MAQRARPGLEPQGVIFDHVVTIMDIAVAEHTITENPCRSRLIKRPEASAGKSPCHT